jgi:autotransporter-associated beta strand protein
MKVKITRIGIAAALAMVLSAQNLFAAVVTWSASPGTWDVGTTLNWNGGGSVFNNGDTAIFSNLGAAGAGASVVTIVGTVLPAVTTVSSPAANVNYTFSGSGSIGGTGPLLKTGASTLTLGTANTFTGGTVIGGGIVVVTNTAVGQFGTGSITLTNGGALTLYRATTTDDGSTSGFLTNALIIPTGQTGIISNSPRGTISSSLTGGGTLNFRANASRGDISGNWSAFTGQINVTGVSGGNLRCTNVNGFPLVKMNFANGSALGCRVPGTPVIPVGELAGDFNSSLIAPNTGNESLSVIWRVGGLNTSVTNNGNIAGATGFIKEGSGTWTLGGTNTTCTGTITVSNGVLALTGNTSFSNSPALAVVSGAVLDVSARGDVTLTLYTNQTLRGGGMIRGNLTALTNSTIFPGDSVGVLTVTNTVTLGGALQMELNNSLGAVTNDRIAATTINYGGTLTVSNVGPALVAGQSFLLFSGVRNGNFAAVNLPTNGTGGVSYTWTNKLTVDGTIQVLTASGSVNTNPTNITSVVNGGNLELSWPTSHTGWHLQAQTNSVSVGLGNNWVTIPGTDAVNHFTNTINPAKGAVFYRMVFP